MVRLTGDTLYGDALTVMLATALSPRIGYEVAASIAAEARATGRTIREIANERTDLPEDELDDLLDVRRITGPE